MCSFTTNKTQNSKNQVVQETTNQQINDAQIANKKFVGNWILAYMSGNSTEPKISDIYGEEVAISLDIKADGTSWNIIGKKQASGKDVRRTAAESCDSKSFGY